jgi:hypothetical protein
MYQSVFAAVNEIFIYGHPISSNSAKSRNGKKKVLVNLFLILQILNCIQTQ